MKVTTQSKIAKSKKKKKKPEKKCANCGGNHISSYKGCPVYYNARQEAKTKPNKKTYATATKIEVLNKISKNEKINIVLFCSELIRTCLMKSNIKIKTSNVLSYAANIALAHLGLTINGEELFHILKNPQFPEHAEAIEKIRKKKTLVMVHHEKRFNPYYSPPKH